MDITRAWRCLRKTRYATEQMARAQIKKQRPYMEPRMKHTLEAYECEYCDGWHLGKNRAKIIAAEEEKQREEALLGGV